MGYFPGRAALAWVLVTQVACAPITTYEPPASPRIHIRADGTIVKHGEVVASLEEAVRGHPEAEAEARRAAVDRRDSLRALIVGGAVGAAALIVAGALAAARSAPRAVEAVGLGGVMGFYGAFLATSSLSRSSKRHRALAVRLYNDALPPCPPCPPAAMATSAANKNR